MTSVRPASVGVMAGFVAVFLIACGSGGDEASRAGSAPAAGGVDACTLLTAAEIGEVLRTEIGSPQHAPSSMPGSPISICQWPRHGQAAFLLFFQLSVTPNAAASHDEWAAGMARDLGEPLDPATNRRVDGIGDWAVYVEDSRTLLVGVGRRLLHVMVDGASAETEAIALGRLALARLGG